MKEFLNILIRTGGRPVYFNRLMENIRLQSYTNYRLIVSADSDEAEEYVREAGITPVRIERMEKSPQYAFPWNLYLNTLMEQVTNGWVMFMDDDDMYAHDFVFQIIERSLPDENTMLVWQMMFPDWRLVPDHFYMNKTPFTRKQIGMPCFAFHSKWIKHVRFDGQRAGDYRFTNELLRFVKVSWLEVPLVLLDNFGNAGNRMDLKELKHTK